MKNYEIKTKINEELSSLGDEFIVLLNLKPEYYFDSVLETVKFMTDRGFGGVYLTSSHPYRFTKNRFNSHNINIENMFVIDTISCMAGENPGEKEECVFIENPTALEEIGMWANMLMDRIKTKNKFLVVDSLSTLLIYNEITALKEFSQFLINRLRLSESSGIFASMEDETVRFSETLSYLCDKTIKF